MQTELSDGEDEEPETELFACHVKLTFAETMNYEICSILCQYLSSSEIFGILAGLSQDQNRIVNKLKTYPKLWKGHFISEFMSDRDKNSQKYANNISEFTDLYAKGPVDSWFDFYKSVIIGQMQVRQSVS